MRLVFLGPPGAGKGTQAKLLVSRFSLAQVSTGDRFREALRSGTDVGLEARRYMEQGALVPDEVVNRIVEDALDEIGRDDFILDGFPRTVQQATWLLEFLEKHDPPLDAVISLHADEDVIVRRLSQRRMDPETGAIYHLDFNPPPADVPSERLVQRSDDRPEAIRTRLQAYESETRPIKALLDQHVRVIEVDGLGEIQEVHQRILTALSDARVTQPV